jgi:hypothetical protein
MFLITHFSGKMSLVLGVRAYNITNKLARRNLNRGEQVKCKSVNSCP